jgi:N6-adenosine-specific RNA methylase IME4
MTGVKASYLPANYTAARRALDACVRVDEVKGILDKSIAMEVYAYQAKDGELAEMAVEVRERATRRIGELMDEDRKAGKLAKGTQGSPVKGARVDKKPTLAEQGIDKNLADRARKRAALPEKEFERQLEQKKKLAAKVAEGKKELIAILKAEKHAEALKRRKEREANLAQKIAALPKKKYGVIYADPEWKFETYSPKGKTEKSAENHYLTSDLAIKARDVPSISASDAVLFLWSTVPMQPQAYEVMAAWGFTYVSQIAWVKDRAGTGYWTRNKHEVLLIGKRGNVPAPAMGTQPESVVHDAVGKHSAKPDIFYDIIEAMFPTLPKIELNARDHREGWDSWGTLEHAA